MVIRRGNVTWGSNLSLAELHFSESSLNGGNATAPNESNDSWFGRQCSVLSNSNPQSQVKWVGKLI